MTIQVAVGLDDDSLEMSIAGRIREPWSPIPRPSTHPTGAEV